jgi:hypothetical protein
LRLCWHWRTVAAGAREALPRHARARDEERDAGEAGLGVALVLAKSRWSPSVSTSSTTYRSCAPRMIYSRKERLAECHYGEEQCKYQNRKQKTLTIPIPYIRVKMG